MCLTININAHEKKDGYYHAIVAKNPILTQKAIEFKWQCMTTPFQYEPVKFKDGIFIMKPRKAWPFEAQKYGTIDKSGQDDTQIKYGIHSYYDEYAADGEMEYARQHYWDFKLFKAIIPPRAKYYVGREGDIVSSKLIVFETDEAYEKYVAEHYPKKKVITLDYPIY